MPSTASRGGVALDDLRLDIAVQAIAHKRTPDRVAHGITREQKLDQFIAHGSHGRIIPVVGRVVGVR